MGVVSGLSIVGKRIDQDHAAAPPRSRSIVGTTAIGRAKKTYLSLSFSLSRFNHRPSSSAPDSAHRMGVASGLSIVGKRIDQDHALAPPRLRSIVGTTVVGRARNNNNNNLPASLRPVTTPYCQLQPTTPPDIFPHKSGTRGRLKLQNLGK